MADTVNGSTMVEPPIELVDSAALLRASLETFRAMLSTGWSPETAYPGSVDSAGWTAGDPTGQCGVSSAWLAKELAKRYAIEARYCRGSVFCRGRTGGDLIDHCWLELLDATGATLVLDLTCDQVDGFDHPGVLDRRESLAELGVHFITNQEIGREELPQEGVWPRYCRLAANIRQSAERRPSPGRTAGRP